MIRLSALSHNGVKPIQVAHSPGAGSGFDEHRYVLPRRERADVESWWTWVMSANTRPAEYVIQVTTRTFYDFTSCSFAARALSRSLVISPRMGHIRGTPNSAVLTLVLN